MKHIISIVILSGVFVDQIATADLLCKASGKIQGISEVRIQEGGAQFCYSINKGQKECHLGAFSGSSDLLTQPVMTGVTRFVSITTTGSAAPNQYQLEQSSVCSSYYYEERGCDDERVIEISDQLVCHQ